MSRQLTTGVLGRKRQTQPPSEPAIWLEVDKIQGASNNDVITLWNDNSGNECNAENSNELTSPVYVTNQINGLPVLRFDGTKYLDFLVENWDKYSFLWTTEVDIYIVSRLTGTASAQCIMSRNVGGVVQRYTILYRGTTQAISKRIGGQINYEVSNAFTQNEYFILESTIDSELLDKIIVNNDFKGESSGATMPFPDPGPISIGRNTEGNNFYFTGDIAAMFFYNRNLNAEERIQMYKYLEKYNITLSL